MDRRSCLSVIASFVFGLFFWRGRQALAKDDAVAAPAAVYRDFSAEEIADEIVHVHGVRGLDDSHAHYSEKWDAIGAMYARLFHEDVERESLLGLFTQAMLMAVERLEPGLMCYPPGSPLTNAEDRAPAQDWVLSGVPVISTRRSRGLWVADELGTAVNRAILNSQITRAIATQQIGHTKFPYKTYETAVTGADVVLQLTPLSPSQLRLRIHILPKAVVSVNVETPLQNAVFHLVL